MSGWDAYINALRGDGSVITGAGIYGAAAQPSLWAASSNSLVSADELKSLYNALTNESAYNAAPASGLYVGGVKYMMINSEAGKILRGKAGENAVAIGLSKKALVLATGKGSPNDISGRVERMTADLSTKGF